MRHAIDNLRDYRPSGLVCNSFLDDNADILSDLFSAGTQLGENAILNNSGTTPYYAPTTQPVGSGSGQLMLLGVFGIIIVIFFLFHSK